MAKPSSPKGVDERSNRSGGVGEELGNSPKALLEYWVGLRCREMASRWSHDPEIAGSNPAGAIGGIKQQDPAEGLETTYAKGLRCREVDYLAGLPPEVVGSNPANAMKAARTKGRVAGLSRQKSGFKSRRSCQTGRLSIGRRCETKERDYIMLPDGEEKPIPIPTSEAGRKGGSAAVRDKYGEDYYRQIGKKGGTALKAKRGSEYYRDIARKGGAANKTKYGAEYFAAMGKRGGNATKESQDPDFYSRIGELGGAAKKQKKET